MHKAHNIYNIVNAICLLAEFIVFCALFSGSDDDISLRYLSKDDQVSSGGSCLISRRQSGRGIYSKRMLVWHIVGAFQN